MIFRKKTAFCTVKRFCIEISEMKCKDIIYGFASIERTMRRSIDRMNTTHSMCMG